VYKNLIFNQGPGERNEYRDWLNENGHEIPEVSEPFFGNNPHLRVQELRAKLSGPEEASIPAFLSEEAIKHTRKATENNKPFFLWLNFWGPHTPCLIPEPWYSMYDPKSIPVDPAFEETFKDKPIHQKHISQMWGVNELPWEEWQKIIARYYGYISLIDYNIGLLMNDLKEQNVYNNSLIVFTADHGDAMGSNKLIEKGAFMYDTSYKIPMIIKPAGTVEQNRTCEDFIYLHDLFPTAIETAGETAPELKQAHSLLPLIEKREDYTSRDFIYAQFTAHFTEFHQRMIRTKRYKFIFNGPAEGELYDLVKDPCEMTNLMENSDYSEIKADLKEKLLNEMKRVNDPVLSWFSRIRDVY